MWGGRGEKLQRGSARAWPGGLLEQRDGGNPEAVGFGEQRLPPPLRG